MNITEQITSQIDAVVQSIDSYSRAVQAEKQRTAQACSAASTRSASQKKQVQQHSDAQIQKWKDALENRKDSLNKDRQEVADFEQELSRLIPRSRIGTIPSPNGKFTTQDARALISRIKETGFWAWLKKILALGNYDTNKKMAAELYGKIDDYYKYHARQVAAEEKKCKDRINTYQQNTRKNLAAIDAQYRQDVQNENSTHSANLRALQQQEQRLLADPRIAAIEKQLANANNILGMDPAGWKSYAPVNNLAENLLVGAMLWPCKIGSPTPEATKVLTKFSNYRSEANGFVVPLSVPLNKPVLIYADCEMGDVKPAASLYQSIIARMIRFMPPKAFKSVFFDPVNRSTSLGQLIHLSGEGSSQICEYHLSPQDINANMSKLTEHVDKICRKLTGAGVADTNAYNAIPKLAHIPYRAVVIHDYPNGFDSTSLGYLQVLINKAEQCGISIMISHKKGDKIEHKALELLNVINRKFYHVQFLSETKARITRGGSTYSFKPRKVDLPAEYLNGINKRFTYKAPVDNSFTKIFGNTLPACRSAKDGLDLPFAVDENGKVVELKIGYDLSAYGLMSGGVGSGKTTSMHMIITSAIMHYAPSELELWVVDFKVAEFAYYTRNCPPHIRYVCADRSSEIAYSVMEEIDEEIKRRQQAFFNAHVKDYKAYYESAYGRAHKLPRILILIDEFHRMAQAAQEEPEYKLVLENIFSEARSHGIVLLLCDQEISNGLNGLSQKSRDLISVRIALRNKPEEIRTLLATDNALLTEDMKKMILDTTSAVEGSGIYKYEGKKDQFTNQVIFKTCRGIYAKETDRTAVIAAVSRKHPGFKRDKSFHVGAARQRMNIPQLKAYEQTYPQNPELGERFYIGTPLGIQPCFYFNLKPAEGGENILLVGSNQEKRLAILRAIISCAGRYHYTIKIFAARASKLYRQNKGYFDSVKKAEVITSFPEICKYVGEKANQIKQLYSDEDYEPEGGNTKELAIFVGFEEIYAQMDASTLTQKAAWTVQEDTAKTGKAQAEAERPAKPATSSGLLTFNFSAPQKRGGQAGGKSNQGASSNLDSYISELDAMLKKMDEEDNARKAAAGGEPDHTAGMASLKGMLASLEEDTEDASVTRGIPNRMAGSAGSGIKGYNAISDLALLISDGWKIGINSMAVLDRGTAFNKMRPIKLEGNFNHRIAMVMSPDEAGVFMSKTRAMKVLVDAQDPITAIYENMGGREQCFRPFVFD